MKNVVLVAALAVAILLAAAPMAEAFTLEGKGVGPFVAHLRDGSSLYAPDPGAAAKPRVPFDWGAVPAGWAGTAPALGDENRAVVNMDQFIFSSGLVEVPEGELTGLFYESKIINIIPIGPANAPIGLVIEYGAAGRNPLAPLADTPLGSGGVVEIWSDTTVENNQSDTNFLYDVLDPTAADGSPNGSQAAPLLWAEAGHSSGRDAFPNVNLTTDGLADDDATLWLQAMIVPVGVMADGTPILLRETIFFASGAGFY